MKRIITNLKLLIPRTLKPPNTSFPVPSPGKPLPPPFSPPSIKIKKILNSAPGGIGTNYSRFLHSLGARGFGVHEGGLRWDFIFPNLLRKQWKYLLLSEPSAPAEKTKINHSKRVKIRLMRALFLPRPWIVVLPSTTRLWNHEWIQPLHFDHCSTSPVNSINSDTMHALMYRRWPWKIRKSWWREYLSYQALLSDSFYWDFTLKRNSPNNEMSVFNVSKRRGP